MRLKALLLAFLIAGGTLADEVAPDSVESLRALMAQGQFAEVEERTRSLLFRVEAVHGADAIEVAAVLDLLSESRWRQGKIQEAETREHAERALRIKEARLGPDHADVAESLNNLAVIAFFLGDYEKARPPWERALAVREKALGSDHIDVAQSLNNLANLLQTIGDFDGARRMHERALAVREKLLGPDDRYVAQTLNNLGNLLRQTGEFVPARSALERALAIRKKALGPDHPKVGSSVSALATLLWLQGDREQARALFEQSIEIWKQALGPDHPYVGSAMNNLGYLLMNAGEYDAARPLFEAAVEVFTRAHGPAHYDVGESVHNLGALQRYAGRLDEAGPLLERAAGIREEALGAGHPYLGESLDTLGLVQLGQGRTEQALVRFERALTIRREALGAEHPDVAETLVHQAFLLAGTGATSRALELALESERIAREHLRLTGRSLSELEALRYEAVRTRGLDLALSIALTDESADSGRGVLDSLIQSRAVVLDEMAARQRAIVSVDDPRIAELADALASSRARLANLTVRGLGDEDPERYRVLLESARDQKEAAERGLAEASAVFRKQRERSRRGLDAIVSHLPPASALVSFVVHELTKPPATGEPSGDAPRIPSAELTYTAVIQRGADAPRFVPLGPARTIEKLVSKWKREASTGAANIRRSAEENLDAYRQVGAELRRVVWDPLAEHLEKIDLVILVPDGAINLVSFGSLPVGEDRYLVERGPLVHYLSAERDLVGTDGPTGRGLLALGGPDYDKAVSAIPNGGTAEATSTTRSSCGSFDTLRFKPLPAAEKEASEIASIWREAMPEASDGSEEVVHLSGAAASESAFKRGARGRRVLHVATHGFFLGGDCAPAGTRSRGFSVSEEPESAPVPDIGLSPLLVSGLALAGANDRGSAGSVEDNGVLTAEEIASLDLIGVEWAVLSACDTGVGEIAIGEGVFGLRRAMQVAGVRTLIMSLWPVDDEATRRFMTTLYEARLERGQATAEAMRQAGLEVLRARRAEGETTHPFYWAAFVAAGDWR